MSTMASQGFDSNTLKPPFADPGGRLDPRGSQIATTVYAGLFQATGPVESYLWNTPSLDSLSAKCEQLLANGLAMTGIDTKQIAGEAWYIGTWTPVPNNGNYLWRTTDWDDFSSKFDDLKGSMRLLDFDIATFEGSVYFTGTWGGAAVAQTLVHGLSWQDFAAQWKSLSSQGQRLARVQIFPAADTWHVTGLFEPGDGEYGLLYETDWAKFFAYYESHLQDMNLVDFQIYDDGPARIYIGVWRAWVAKQTLVIHQDWGSFVARWKSLAKDKLMLQKAIVYYSANEPPAPQWGSVFQAALGDVAMGYAYAILQNGEVVESAGLGLSRASQDAPQTDWTPTTRLNLASVSKPITAVATMKLLADNSISLDDPFYPYVQAQFPTVGTDVDKVTIRNLLEMKSGMPPDQTLWTDSIWTFLNQYLQGSASNPGQGPSVYSNTNFTILQAVIECVLGYGGDMTDHYASYVSQAILEPMGIDTSIFNTIPDPTGIAALGYYSGSETTSGVQFSQITCTAAGGWITSAQELAKFLAGVRANTVLSAADTATMLEGQLGWYRYDGIYGPYYNHDGGLYNEDSCPYRGLGRVDEFEQDEACCESDDGPVMLCGLLAA